MVGVVVVVGEESFREKFFECCFFFEREREIELFCDTTWEEVATGRRPDAQREGPEKRKAIKDCILK